MTNSTSLIKRGLLSSLVLLFTGTSLLGPAIIVSADSPSDSCAIPQTNSVGVNKPVGADAVTYSYNCDTGLWENAHYTYNPATGLTTAKDPTVYTYNANTGKYDYPLWVYNAPSRDYVAVTQSVGTPPAGATVIGAPKPVVPAAASISNTGPNSNNTVDTDNGTAGGTISNTGPGSNNSVGSNNGSNATLNNQTTATMNNRLDSQAQTGNALVLGNTSGGGASTGDAQALANVVNMLQSSSNALGSGMTTFVANIDGDVNGDLLIDPTALGNVQRADGVPTGNSNLTINNQTGAAINNDINLAAQSGDATVANNTSGGNASTGQATAIANVVNLINSAITSGKSFLGVININGNFNGDILMPQSFLDQLVASNVPTVSISTTGPGSNNTIDNGQSGNNTSVNNSNNQGINSVVNATANSGNAAVSNNTSAGNATTGNAGTNITAFNLTGSNIIGSNDLLVFVNVLGTWVGMIVNAPAGTTAAELGSGITSASAIPTTGNNDTTINNTANQQINNTINASANSGNATVDSNTKAGNATSGNAKTAINLLNVQNSSLSLAGWFGILFINVFGNWNGSFGVNTSAGDPVIEHTASPSQTAVASSGAKVTSTAQVFRYVPAPNRGTTGYSSGAGISNTGPSSNNTIAGAVLAAAHNRGSTITPTPQLDAAHSNFGRMVAIIGGFVVAIIALDAISSFRRNQHNKPSVR